MVKENNNLGESKEYNRTFHKTTVYNRYLGEVHGGPRSKFTTYLIIYPAPTLVLRS